MDLSGFWLHNIARMVRVDGAGNRSSDCGTGTLIDTVQNGLCILTCAHVVNQMRGLGSYAPERPALDDVFYFNMPERSGDELFRAQLLEWWPARNDFDRLEHPISDIALLKVMSELPGSVRPYSLDNFTVADLATERVKAFGFPGGNGEAANGVLTDPDATGWLRFKNELNHERFIVPGFSGAALFQSKGIYAANKEETEILGIVVSITNVGDGQAVTAYAQPTQHLWTACPQLARPYRGLLDFEERDQKFFFGRTDFVTRLRSRLTDHPIVGVTAASGSGKSSVVKAGLVPLLRKELCWCIVSMRPGKDPWLELARGLQDACQPKLSDSEKTNARDDLQRRLRKDPEHLKEYLRDVSGNGSGIDRVLIIVDQFEELFTLAGHDRYNQDETDKKNHKNKIVAEALQDFRDFMVQTGSLVDTKRVPTLQWIYTLRADFSGPAYRHKRFVDALNEGDEKLADMDEAELRQAIVRPAEMLEVGFEAARHDDGLPSVNERIADAVTAHPGSLPLMAHLLEKLWERLDNRKISHRAYEDLGGLEGALNQHANDVYDKLTQDEKRLTRRLFSRLVKIGDDSELTRRAQVRRDLGEELWGVTEPLIKSRLLVVRGASNAQDQSDDGGTNSDDSSGGETVEVAHEALLRNWDKLQGWLKDDMAFLLWRQRLDVQIEEWLRFNKANGQLLSDEALSEALGWINGRHKQDLTQQQITFIQTSKNQQDKRKNLQRIAASIFGLVVLISAVGGIYFYTQLKGTVGELNTTVDALEKSKAVAEKSAEEALMAQTKAERLTTEANAAREQIEREADLAAIKISSRIIELGQNGEALAALRPRLPDNFNEIDMAKKSDVLAGLLRTVINQETYPPISHLNDETIDEIKFSADGNIMVSASNTAGVVRVWNGADGGLLYTLVTNVISNDIFLSPNGDRLIVAKFNDEVEGRPLNLVDVKSGKYIKRDFMNGKVIGTIEFSPSGKFIYLDGNENSYLIDSRNGDLVEKFPTDNRFDITRHFIDDDTLVISSYSQLVIKNIVIQNDLEIDTENNIEALDFGDFQSVSGGHVIFSRDQGIYIYDLIKKQTTKILENLDSEFDLWESTFSRNNKFLALTIYFDSGEEYFVLDLNNLSILFDAKNERKFSGRVLSLGDFSPDETFFSISDENEGSIYLLNLKSDSAKKIFDEIIFDITEKNELQTDKFWFVPNSSNAIFINYSGVASIWNLNTISKIDSLLDLNSISNNTMEITTNFVTPVFTKDENIIIIDRLNGKILSVLPSNVSDIWDVSMDRNFLLHIKDDRLIVTRFGDFQQSYEFHYDFFSHNSTVKFTKNSEFLLIEGHDDRRVMKLSLPELNVVSEYNLTEISASAISTLNSPALEEEYLSVISGSDLDGTISFLVQDSIVTLDIRDSDQVVELMASENGALYFLVLKNGEIGVWERESGKELWRIHFGDYERIRAAFSTGANQILVWPKQRNISEDADDIDGVEHFIPWIRILNAKTGQQIHEIPVSIEDQKKFMGFATNLSNADENVYWMENSFVLLQTEFGKAELFDLGTQSSIASFGASGDFAPNYVKPLADGRLFVETGAGYTTVQISPRTARRNEKSEIVFDDNGKALWDYHPAFSQGLLDRADQLVPKAIYDKLLDPGEFEIP